MQLKIIFLHMYLLLLGPNFDFCIPPRWVKMLKLINPGLKLIYLHRTNYTIY